MSDRQDLSISVNSILRNFFIHNLSTVEHVSQSVVLVWLNVDCIDIAERKQLIFKQSDQC